MSKGKRRTKEFISGQAQKSEDVERISDIVNRRIKKSNAKLGAPSDKKKNPFLLPNGGFNLIETFPSYKDKRKKLRGDKL